MQTPKVSWHVSLSNGETCHEGKGGYQIVEGELSPWQRLISYISKEKLVITSIGLSTPDGRVFNLPSAGKNPRFREFLDVEKPVSYRMFRKVGQDIQRSDGKVIAQDFFTVAEAQYENYRLQVWVDENSLHSWSAIV